MLVPLISYVFFKGAWMMGYASAPYDPRWARRFPKQAALMASAGPIANFILAVLAGGLIIYGVSAGWLQFDGSRLAQFVSGADGKPSIASTALSILFATNVLLGTFNLLPLPPLDGHAVVPLLLSERATYKYFNLFRAPGAQVMGIAIAFALYSKAAPYVFQGSWDAVMYVSAQL